jgi:hypothetical protein
VAIDGAGRWIRQVPSSRDIASSCRAESNSLGRKHRRPQRPGGCPTACGRPLVLYGLLEPDSAPAGAEARRSRVRGYRGTCEGRRGPKGLKHSLESTSRTTSRAAGHEAGSLRAGRRPGAQCRRRLPALRPIESIGPPFRAKNLAKQECTGDAWPHKGQMTRSVDARKTPSQSINSLLRGAVSINALPLFLYRPKNLQLPV